jgi:hypothetical protein
MSLTKLSLAAGLIKLFPARESLVSDIPAGDGKTANLFLLWKVSENSVFHCFPLLASLMSITLAMSYIHKSSLVGGRHSLGESNEEFQWEEGGQHHKRCIPSSPDKNSQIQYLTNRRERYFQFTVSNILYGVRCFLGEAKTGLSGQESLRWSE